jgi:pyruvyl transferase EpsI
MLKELFDFKTKYRSLLFLQQFKKPRYFKDVTLDASKKYAFFFLAADYGNLGDVAITYAQTKFIQEHSDYEVLEIPLSKSLEGLIFVKRVIKKNDIVTIVGGGNLGDLYEQIEFIRQLVVKSFPNNKIISFPQTFDFKKEKELEIAKKVYSAHPNLYLIAREVISYQLMQQHFKKNKIFITPDIVLSLVERKVEQRKGALVCIRNDKEGKMADTQKISINTFLQNRFEKIACYDTHLGKNGLSEEERVNELFKIWEAFRTSELVVTDRLHGMVFCYITNTPCIVFPNINHKIKGTYEWIKDEPTLIFTEECKDELINKVLERAKSKDNKAVLVKEKFQPLIDLLN